MCGILGIINKYNKKIDSNIVKTMMSNIDYRGPDDNGFVSFTNNDIQHINIKERKELTFDLLLAHNRLSIIDTTSDGHQPFTANDLNNKYWIVFNGEIYNYIEIRDELIKKGYKFYTKTDTEVVLKAYIEWGDEAQNKFNGMWAIIIYNTQSQDIWVSRDRLGKKPLYYYENSDYLIFSSEIKQILPLVDLQENKLETQAIMLTNYRGHLKETSFQNVYRFPSSHSLKFNKDSIKYDFIKYWELTYDKNTVYDQVDNQKLATYSEEFYNIFYDLAKMLPTTYTNLRKEIFNELTFFRERLTFFNTQGESSI